MEKGLGGERAPAKTKGPGLLPGLMPQTGMVR